jgi:predicted nucleic acid-binding protein
VIVLDASVLIAHLDRTDAHHDEAFGLLSGLAGERFAASALTIAEVLVGPTRAGASERAGSALRALGVDTVPIGETAPAALARLRVETRLKLPDCCVLLAAEQVGGGLVTLDGRLAGAARGRGVAVVR